MLLEGESGTGKEILARAVHARSARAAKPFVAIHCAVLSENLIESELFGHEKGAFTGAHTQRRGRIELSDGGTFFLDEVAELLPNLQAKLLRVLEESFERVGGTKPLRVDVRWIAPLRERREDIVPLAEMLLVHLSSAARRPAPTLSDAAKTRLMRSTWTGNVRQLRNALERAMILRDGPVLDADLFGPAPQDWDAKPDDGLAEDASLETLERRAIESALTAVGGNRRAAAARLGMGLRTLYEKLKRYESG